MNQTVMKLPADTAGFSMRGIQFPTREDPEHGLVVEVPEDCVPEAKENGLIPVKTLLSDEAKAEAEAEAARLAAEEAEEAEAARVAAEAEAARKAEEAAEAAKKIQVGDTVTFEDDGNQLSGVVKEIRTVKKVEVADVEVTLPDSDPEVWEVNMSALTKVVKE